MAHCASSPVSSVSHSVERKVSTGSRATDADANPRGRQSLGDKHPSYRRWRLPERESNADVPSTLRHDERHHGRNTGDAEQPADSLRSGVKAVHTRIRPPDIASGGRVGGRAQRYPRSSLTLRSRNARTRSSEGRWLPVHRCPAAASRIRDPPALHENGTRNFIEAASHSR